MTHDWQKLVREIIVEPQEFLRQQFALPKDTIGDADQKDVESLDQESKENG